MFGIGMINVIEGVHKLTDLCILSLVCTYAASDMYVTLHVDQCL